MLIYLSRYLDQLTAKGPLSGDGVTWPFPRDGDTELFETQHLSHAQGLYQRSKMACWRGSDLGQSRRRWVKSCSWWPQVLQGEFSFCFILLRLEVKRKLRRDFRVFESSSPCYYQSNKGRGYPVLSALPKDTTNKVASLSSQYPFNAECKAEKLQIPTF